MRWVLFLALGIRYSFSVFFVAILDEYGWGRGETAGAFSLAMLVHGLFAPVTGTLVDRLGPRKLFPVGAMFLIMGLVAASSIRALWHLYLYFGVVVAVDRIWNRRRLGRVRGGLFLRYHGKLYGSFHNASGHHPLGDRGNMAGRPPSKSAILGSPIP